MVDPVAEDVQVLVLGVDARELHRGDELHGCVRERLRDAVDAVVVGQRKQLDTGRAGALHHFGG